MQLNILKVSTDVFPNYISETNNSSTAKVQTNSARKTNMPPTWLNLMFHIQCVHLLWVKIFGFSPLYDHYTKNS